MIVAEPATSNVDFCHDLWDFSGWGGALNLPKPATNKKTIVELLFVAGPAAAKESEVADRLELLWLRPEATL
jgi:hypothetical protein